MIYVLFSGTFCRYGADIITLKVRTVSRKAIWKLKIISIIRSVGLAYQTQMIGEMIMNYHLVFLFDEIDQIEKKHLNNECYYRLSPRLGDQYDWLLPPEYKRSLSGNTKPEWNTGSDMYYFMIKFYERVTGKKPEVNFQMNNLAVLDLVRCLDIDDNGKKAIAWLFVRCTAVSESKRIKNASEFKSSEAFGLLMNEHLSR